MMRDKYIAYVDAEDIITQMFWDSISDHNAPGKILCNGIISKDEIRCAITVFCNDIKNYLIDHYNVDLDEVEEQAINEIPERCCSCKYSELVRYCNENNNVVGDLDACSDWEERG